MRSTNYFQFIPLAILALTYSGSLFGQNSQLTEPDLETSPTEHVGAPPPSQNPEIQIKSLYWLTVSHAEDPEEAFREFEERYRGRSVPKSHLLSPAARDSIRQEVRSRPRMATNQFLELVRSLLRDPDENVAYIALSFLSDDFFQGGDLLPLFIPELIPLLARDDNRIQGKAADLLPRVTSPGDYVRILIPLLSDPDPNASAFAVVNLNELANYDYENPKRRGTVEEELMREALPAIVDLLKLENSYDRSCAAGLIGFLSAPSNEYAEEIAQLLYDPHHIARMGALDSLMHISDLPEECGPPLLHVLVNDEIVFQYRRSPPYSEVIAVAISGLGKNAEPILPELKRARRFSLNRGVRRRAKRALKLLKSRLEESSGASEESSEAVL